MHSDDAIDIFDGENYDAAGNHDGDSISQFNGELHSVVDGTLSPKLGCGSVDPMAEQTIKYSVAAGLRASALSGAPLVGPGQIEDAPAQPFTPAAEQGGSNAAHLESLGHQQNTVDI